MSKLADEDSSLLSSSSSTSITSIGTTCSQTLNAPRCMRDSDTSITSFACMQHLDFVHAKLFTATVLEDNLVEKYRWYLDRVVLGEDDLLDQQHQYLSAWLDQLQQSGVEKDRMAFDAVRWYMTRHRSDEKAKPEKQTAAIAWSELKSKKEAVQAFYDTNDDWTCPELETLLRSCDQEEQENADRIRRQQSLQRINRVVDTGQTLLDSDEPLTEEDVGLWKAQVHWILTQFEYKDETTKQRLLALEEAVDAKQRRQQHAERIRRMEAQWLWDATRLQTWLDARIAHVHEEDHETVQKTFNKLRRAQLSRLQSSQTKTESVMSRVLQSVETLQKLLDAQRRKHEEHEKRIQWQIQHERLSDAIDHLTATIWQTMTDLTVRDGKPLIDSWRSSVAECQAGVAKLSNGYQDALQLSWLQTKCMQLAELLDHAEAVIKLRAKADMYFERAEEWRATGLRCQTALQEAIKLGTESDVVDQCLLFNARTNELWREYGATIRVPECSAALRANRPTPTCSTERVCTIVLDRMLQIHQELQHLGTELTGLQRRYSMAMALNQELAVFVQRATTVRAAFEQQRDMLCNADEGGSSPETLPDVIESETTALEQSMSELRVKLASIHGCALDLSAAEEAMKQVRLEAKALSSVAERCTRRAQARSAQAGWEQAWHSADVVLKQLERDLATCTSDLDLSTSTNTASLMDRVSILEQRLDAFDNKEGKQAIDSFQTMQNVMLDTGLLDAKTALSLDTRQKQLVDGSSRLSEQINKLKAMIQYVDLRGLWNADYQAALLAMDDYQGHLEEIVKSCRSLMDIENQQKTLDELQSEIQRYNVNTSHFEQLQKHVCDYLQYQEWMPLADAEAWLDQLENKQNAVMDQLAFAQQVMAHAWIMDGFNKELDSLQQMLEQVPDQLLSRENRDRLTASRKRLVDLEKRVREMHNDPVRTYDATVREGDIQANAAIRRQLLEHLQDLDDRQKKLEDNMAAQEQKQTLDGIVKTFQDRANSLLSWINEASAALHQLNPGEVNDVNAVSGALFCLSQQRRSIHDYNNQHIQLFYVSVYQQITEIKIRYPKVDTDQAVWAIEQQQARVKEAWRRLDMAAIELDDRLNAQLRMAEYIQAAQVLEARHDELRTASFDSNEWQRQFTVLEKESFAWMTSRLSAESHKQNRSRMEAILDQAWQRHQDLMSLAKTVVQDTQLKAQLEELISGLEKEIKETLKLKHIEGTDDREQKLVLVEQRIRARVAKHKADMDHIHALQRSMSNKSAVSMGDLERLFLEVQMTMAEVAQQREAATQWCQVVRWLNEIKLNELQYLQQMVQCAESSQDIHDAANGVKAALDAISKRISSIDMVDEELKAFAERTRTEIGSELDKQLQEWDTRQQRMEKQARAEEQRDVLDQIRQTAEQEQRRIMQASHDTLDVLEGKAIAIFDYYSQTIAWLSDSETLLHSLSDQLKPIPRETDGYHQTEKALNDLSLAIDGLDALQQMLKVIADLIGTAEEIELWIASCDKTFDRYMLASETKDNQDEKVVVAFMERKLADYCPVVDTFLENVVAFLEKEDSRVNIIVTETMIKESLQRRAARVELEWERINGRISHIKEAIMHQRQQLAVDQQLTRIEAVITDAQENINRLKQDCQLALIDDLNIDSMPREPEILAMERKLERLESATSKEVQERLICLEEALLQCSVEPSSNVADRQAEIERGIESFNKKSSELRGWIARALSISEYLMIADDVQLLLTDYQERMGSPELLASLSKQDLERMLQELEACQKYYDQQIQQKLDAALDIIEDIHVTEDQVSEHFAYLEGRWSAISSQARARMAMLRQRIHQHEVIANRQRRLRIVSLPTMKASHTALRNPPPLTPSSSLPVTPEPVPAFSQTGALWRKMKNHARKQYEPDPDNDLDVEIGRIVNETPYDIKVKMVPGEAGRYWFGCRHPRLVYCRILKSRMVMVRVGGGWTELSQFLRDHALLEEGIRIFDPLPPAIPAPAASSSSNVQQGFIQTGRRRRESSISRYTPPLYSSNSSSTALSSSSSSSTTSTALSSAQNVGYYMDGDKYVAVDHHGNLHQLTMRKAEQNISSSGGRSIII